jgi:redox-sensitive bicupin YhaK (pirin superfamily)
MNASPDEPVHFVQMWVFPDAQGIQPGYEQRDLNADLARGGLVAIASGQGHPGAIRIHQRGAVLWGARLAAGATATIPGAVHTHVFVPVGSGELSGAGSLGTGDAARLTDGGSPVFAAGPEGAELLVWATD